MTKRTPPSAPFLPKIRVAALFALLFVLALFVATSCAGTAASADDMTIHVTRPANGAVVPRSFTVRVASNVPIGPPDTGRHHIHLYWDGEREEGKYDIVYKKTFKKTGLSPGVHMLDAVIANADHSTTSTHEQLQLTVRKGTKATAGPPPSTNQPTGNGY
jgi:hypothetical protein